MKRSQNSVARITDSLNPSLSQLCPNQTFCVELHCQTTLLSRVISVLLYGACTELGIHGLICTWGKLVVHRLPDRTKEKYSLLWFGKLFHRDSINFIICESGWREHVNVHRGQDVFSSKSFDNFFKWFSNQALTVSIAILWVTTSWLEWKINENQTKLEFVSWIRHFNSLQFPIPLLGSPYYISDNLTSAHFNRSHLTYFLLK